MKIKASFMYNLTTTPGNDCRIEKAVELSPDDFFKLQIGPLQELPFITENKNCMFDEGTVKHCLLAPEEGGLDGVLIQATGSDYPCYAAYISGMRDILNAELDRAVDYIVKQGTENTTSGNWIIGFDELEEKLGLVLRQGNGLYEMLLDKLTDRREVLDLEVTPNGIDAIYCSDFCSNLDEEVNGPPDISPVRKALLFDNTLNALLQLYEGEDLFSMLHDRIGLTLEEITKRDLLSEDDLRYAGPLSRSVLEGGLCVRELFHMEGLPCGVSLMNEQHNCQVPLDSLKKLANSEGSVPGEVLDARVTNIETAPNGSTNIVVSGIEQEEMFRLKDIIDSREQAAASTQTGFPPSRQAEVLENAISSALGLYRGEDMYTMLHDSFGLTIQEIRDHEYLSDQELMDICQVPLQVLEGGMTVRSVLALEDLPERTSLAHKNSVFLVPVEDLKKLIAKGQEDFAALLDAWVADIRVDEGTPELLLEGVEAAELDRLHDELEAHKQAEQAMGPAMG